MASKKILVQEDFVHVSSGSNPAAGFSAFYPKSDNNFYHRTSAGDERKMWDSGNDGAGSGLDADLLDGQEGSYYRAEANLTWGGKNLSESYSPIDAAMVPPLGANRFAFTAAAAIIIEYSQDGGATWLTYSTSDANKVGLLSGNGGNIKVGGGGYPAGTDYTNYRVRVTINTAGQIYTVLNKFILYLRTYGSIGSWCTIDARTQANYVDAIDTWTTFSNQTSVAGWSGYNVINTSGITTYGNIAASQYGQVRFTFGQTGYSASYTGLEIFKILGFGGVGWQTPSNLAGLGSIYSYDSSQNVFFPALVRGTILQSTIATGTAPLVVASSSKVLNLNADLLDGQHGIYYLDYNNLTNKPTSFPPSAHNHDDRYFTETESDARFAPIAHDHSGVYQPLDADLTAIAGLTGTSGFLKKTAANTWVLDTTTYLTGTKVDSFNTRTGAVTLTKADVEAVLTGNITSHTHSYLPLSGGSMLNTNLVTNLNADLLDGLHYSAFATASHNHSFAGLSDVALVSPSAGQMLLYNGSNWVNTDHIISLPGAQYNTIQIKSKEIVDEFGNTEVYMSAEEGIFFWTNIGKPDSAQVLFDKFGISSSKLTGTGERYLSADSSGIIKVATVQPTQYWERDAGNFNVSPINPADEVHAWLFKAGAGGILMADGYLGTNKTGIYTSYNDMVVSEYYLTNNTFYYANSKLAFNNSTNLLTVSGGIDAGSNLIAAGEVKLTKATPGGVLRLQSHGAGITYLSRYDYAGAVTFDAYNGSGYGSPAGIMARASETHSSSGYGTNIEIWNTANGDTNNRSVAIIRQDGIFESNFGFAVSGSDGQSGTATILTGCSYNSITKTLIYTRASVTFSGGIVTDIKSMSSLSVPLT